MSCIIIVDRKPLDDIKQTHYPVAFYTRCLYIWILLLSIDAFQQLVSFKTFTNTHAHISLLFGLVGATMVLILKNILEKESVRGFFLVCWSHRKMRTQRVFTKVLPHHIQHLLYSWLNQYVSHYSHLSKQCIVQGGSELQQSLRYAFSNKHGEMSTVSNFIV